MIDVLHRNKKMKYFRKNIEFQVIKVFLKIIFRRFDANDLKDLRFDVL